MAEFVSHLEQAAQMRAAAARAASEAERRVCLEMAEAWEKLAAGAEELARKRTLDDRVESGVARARALAEYDILDTPREEPFDAVAREAAAVCAAPIAVVNLIDRDRQWFKAEVGLGVRSTPLETSFCAQALLQDDFMVVPDAREDPRFACNPLVTGAPHLRFYAGALLRSAEGVAYGTVCVLDYAPRPEGLTEAQARTLQRLAREAAALIEQRRDAAAGRAEAREAARAPA